MKREKRERGHFSFVHCLPRFITLFLSSFFPPFCFLPFFLFPFFLFFFFPFRYIISIDPPSALKHIKAFFTSQYVCIESWKDAYQGGGNIKLDLLVGRCVREAPCIYIYLECQNKWYALCTPPPPCIILRILQSKSTSRSIDLLWHYVVVANAIFPSIRHNRQLPLNWNR